MADVYRQGDVIIKAVGAKPDGEIELLSHLTLAESEATGHRHRITRGQAELYQMAVGVMYLKVLSDFATLYHEEHEEIELPKGDEEHPSKLRSAQSQRRAGQDKRPDY